jgi:hypothetical protein
MSSSSALTEPGSRPVRSHRTPERLASREAGGFAVLSENLASGVFMLQARWCPSTVRRHPLPNVAAGVEGASYALRHCRQVASDRRGDQRSPSALRPHAVRVPPTWGSNLRDGT